MPRSRKFAALCAAALLSLGPIASLAASAAESAAVLDLRYRWEQVDDAGFARDAQAQTLRLRLGYRWVFAPGWQLYADAEHVQPLFGEHYNSTANGRTQYPVVLDPKSSELNQAFIGWTGEGSSASLGRQRVALDNQRFFGTVGWRQNEQTFDALALGRDFGESSQFRYLYLDRVLRVVGHDHPDPLQRRWRLHGHLLHAEQASPIGRFAAYAYLVENRDMPALSSRTFGLRWTGERELDGLRFDWTLEYAHQGDWANNPFGRSANYRLIEPSLKWRGVTFKAGQEVLGGDGSYGFSTPYATLHAFNGWADRFGTTPLDGLDDRYLGALGSLPGGFGWALTWHDFRADSGRARYGREWDASLSRAFGKHWNLLLKLADYRARDFSTDVRKYWFSVEYRY